MSKRLRSRVIRAIAIVAFSLAGCSDLLFHPGFSSTDKDYFAEPPIVVKRGEQYSLRWRYGSMGFYFYPEYQVKDGALWFSLMATTSTGHVVGRESELLIKGEREVAALKKGGAIWWASDGSKTPLAMTEEAARPTE